MKEQILAEFREKWHDKGDERYGYVKHFNTMLDLQLEDIRSALQRVEEDCDKKWQMMVVNSIEGEVFKNGTPEE